MNLKIDTFGGIQPRLHPSLLADGMAVRAHNVKLVSGKLVPLRQPKEMAGAMTYMQNGMSRIGDAKTLYPWKHTDKDGNVRIDFLAFPGVVTIAQGHLADDEYDRIFVTGKTGVPFTDTSVTPNKTWGDSPAVYLFSRKYNSIDRRTICKSPISSAPSVSLVGSLDDTKTVYYAFFFVSWVDSYGMESGLSKASVATGDAAGDGGELMLNDGSSISFGSLAIPSGATKVRVYMSSAGSQADGSTDAIAYMAEVSAFEAVRGFALRFEAGMLGETEPGIESPPGDLSGIRYVDGGFYAAFSPSSPHAVMFSDIGIVTSWPIAYRYDVKDNIVALAATSNSVFALTDGFPWVLTGTAPETMVVARLAGPAACVSPRSIVVYRNAVYYASHEGYMTIFNNADSGTVCVNLTDKTFTKDQWKALGPETCIAGQYDGALYLFFDGKDGLRIAPSDGNAAVTTHEERASCLCVDDRSDKMYYVRAVIESEGGS